MIALGSCSFVRDVFYVPGMGYGIWDVVWFPFWENARDDWYLIGLGKDGCIICTLHNVWI